MDGTANVVEIFSSVQGEALHVGRSTLFLRFGGCDLRCRWCDSPHTWKPVPSCRIHAHEGRPEHTLQNPLGLSALIEQLSEFGPEAHAFVSLTGGEPLLQPEAVGVVARTLRARGARILLETHGLATAALERVLDAIDVVSMDWKLSSEVRREGQPHREPGVAFDAEHAAFLRVARGAPEVFVKVVVSERTQEPELDRLAAEIAAIDRAVPLVLQPVTPWGPVKQRVAPERFLAWQRRLEQSLDDVRVIPQTHRQLEVP